jgi:hypothetical protein
MLKKETKTSLPPSTLVLYYTTLKSKSQAVFPLVVTFSSNNILIASASSSTYFSNASSLTLEDLQYPLTFVEIHA